MSTRVIQVTNVPTSVTREQFRALFSNLGRIDDIVIYPESESKSSNVAAKVGYVKFSSSETAQAALNLTSTVYIDRPLVISLVRPSSSSSSARIPDESSALKFCPSINTNIVMLPNGPTWSHKVINRKITVPTKDDKPAKTYIETKDMNLTDRSLPEYPNLPGTTDPAKIDQIRRTVFISNLDPRVSLANVYDFFSQIGEIKYIRMTKSIKNVEYENTGKSSDAIKPNEGVDLESDSLGAFIEFSEQPSVVKALCLNGFKFADRQIKVNHSTQTIQIPENKKQQICVDDIKKEKTSNKTENHKSRHGKREKNGSISDNSTKSTDEADSAVESSPPKKQRKSSRSRSNSKSKSKSSRRSRSKEKERKERDRDKKREREREKNRRSHSGSRSSNKKRKDDKDRDREKDKSEKDRSSSNKKEKKDKRRSRDRSS